MYWVSPKGFIGIVATLSLCLGCRPQAGNVVATGAITGVAEVRSSVPWDVPASMKNKRVRDQGRGFTQKIVALTFDDGPSSNNTPQVLDTLDRYAIKGTFFLVGAQMELHPNLVKEIIRRGHVIGNHTFTHAWHPEKQMATKEFEHWESLLKELTGRETHLFRPPFGRVNSAFSLVALKRGYPLILWTNTGADTGTKKSEDVFNNVVGNIHPGDIILLHDAQDKGHTIKALPRIIEALQKKGYSFTTLPELLQDWEKARTERTAKKKNSKKAKPLHKASSKTPHASSDSEQ